MARIAGVDIPDNKRGEIGLTYIFGIGQMMNPMLSGQSLPSSLKLKVF